MGRRIVVAIGSAMAAFSIVGMAVAAPDNKNSITVGMQCDHGIGAITGAAITA